MRYAVPFLVPVLGLALLVAGCGGKDSTTTTTNIMPLQVTIQTQALPGATEGQAYSVQLVASGGSGTFVWTIEAGGTNDGWLLVDDQGVLSGSPTATNVGAVSLIVKASQEGNDSNFDIRAFTFNVTGVAAGFGIATVSLPNAWSGWYYSQQLQATGGSGNFVWRKILGGVNDGWVNVSIAGQVSNTPPGGAVGPVTLHVKVYDADDPNTYATATYDFEVYDGNLTIDNDNPLPNAAAGQTYMVQMRPSGGSGSYVWALESGGVNDAWLSLDAAGTLTGTAPAALGIVSANVSVMDAQNPNLFTQRTFAFQVKLLAISTEDLADAYVSQNYSDALTAQGGAGSVTWTIEPGGTNYAWTQINGSNIESISAPTTNEIGPVEVIIKADDGTNTDARLFRLSVYDTLSLSSTTLSDAYANWSYSQTVPVTGGSGDFAFSIQSGGSNNSWLSIDADTGRLYGTPTSAELGPVQVVVRAEESANSAVFDQQTLSFTVKGLVITTDQLAGASVGQAYSQDLTAFGGSGYCAWSITSGPTWLTVDPNSGRLSGTPSAAGVQTVSVSVYDPLDPLLTDSKSFVLMTANTLLLEDFEGGASGWMFNSYWYLYPRDSSHSTYRQYAGPKDAHSGTNVAMTGTTGLPGTFCPWNSVYYLQSPSITVPASGNCYLTFWHWYQFEEGYLGSSDGGQLQYDLNGNNLWTPLTPTSPAGYPGNAGGQNAFTGFGVSLRDEGWSQVLVDLSALAGNSVRVRWYYYADGDTMRYKGWVVDDVHVFDLGGGANLPMSVHNPMPGNGWTYGVAQTSDFTNGVNLSWEGGLGAASFDVYVGASESAVANATTSSGEFMGNQTGTTYSATSLSAGSTCYWRVDAVNSNGTATGPVWSFTPVNPQKILIGEVNATYYSYRGRTTELLNPSPDTYQNLSQYILNTYGTYTTGWPYMTMSFLPNGLILPPDTARAMADYTVYYHGYSPYRMWDFVNTPVYFNWRYGYYQYEVWLQDPSGNGVDYMGANVSSSNCPTDLTWNGALSSGGSYDTLWARRNNVDTDQASDFRGPYYHYYYGDGYGYGLYASMKDQGQ